jgi:hypothetical protein
MRVVRRREPRRTATGDDVGTTRVTVPGSGHSHEMLRSLLSLSDRPERHPG